jgi:23S rRNA (guanosine2251-2'-O)-methyltransferase
MSSQLRSYFIYGKHPVLAALKNSKRTIKKAFWIKEFNSTKEFEKYKHLFKEVTRAELDKMLGTNSNHQGITIEVLPITSDNLNLINFDANQTIVILDQITDQHNFGSIIRSAVTFNIKNIIISAKNCAQENSTLAKTSSGALEFINLIEVVNINQFIENLKKNGFWVIGLDHNASTYIQDYKAPDKLAIVLGSEDQGIRKLTKQRCDTLVKIPIVQNNLLDSLNVGVAAAISFYELHKRNVQ